jgi:hypothetical protein
MAKIEPTTTVVTPEAANVPQETLNQILQRLNNLEAENAELKNKGENNFSKAKEKYKWPLQAKYWLRAWKPVLSYKSVKAKEEYDWLYKAPNGEWVDNHFLELTLSDGTVVKKVLRNSFDTSKVLSELQEFDLITDRWDKVTKATVDDLQRVSVRKYIFKYEDGEIEVDFNCIN